MSRVHSIANYGKELPLTSNVEGEEIVYAFMKINGKVLIMDKRKTITYEYVKKHLQNLGYELKDKEYVNAQTKLTFVDGDNYKYYTNWNTIQQKDTPRRFAKNNIYTIENMKNFLKIESGTSKLLTEKYSRNTNRVTITCNKCGKEINRIWAQLVSNKVFCCEDCRVSTKKIDYNFIKSEFDKKGFELLDKEYIANSVKMKCRDMDGFLHSLSYQQLHISKDKIIFGDMNPYFKENFNIFFNKYSNNSKVIDIKFGKNKKKTLVFTCSECGCVIEKTWDILNKNKNFQCNKCTRLRLNKEEKKLENAKKIFKEYGFTLLCEDYINSHTKMDCVDKNGYKYTITVDGIKGEHRFLDKSNKYSLYNAQLFLDKYSKGSQLYNTTYVNKNKFNISCEDCGKKIEKSYNRLILSKNFKCSDCNVKQRYVDCGYDINFARQEFEKKGYILLDTEYINNSTKMTCKNKDGYLFKSTLVSIQALDVELQKFDMSNPYTIDNIKLYLKLNSSGATLVTKKFKGTTPKNKLRITCENCGEETSKTWSAIIGNNSFRCYKCSKKQSSLEYKTRCVLDELNIEYYMQHRFDDCRNKNSLPFDFYLCNLNKIIECDGELHYKAISHFGGEEELNNRKELDAIKNIYCNDKNIPLLRIPYWNFKDDSYKEIIKTFVSE